jgi:hypothetical protein
MPPLTPEILKIIEAVIIPADRQIIGELTMGDWEKILEMGDYLGYDAKTLANNLDQAARAKNPQFAGLRMLPIESRRMHLQTLDHHLGTHHLKKFDDTLQQLSNSLSL